MASEAAHTPPPPILTISESALLFKGLFWPLLVSTSFFFALLSNVHFMVPGSNCGKVIFCQIHFLAFPLFPSWPDVLS